MVPKPRVTRDDFCVGKTAGDEQMSGMTFVRKPARALSPGDIGTCYKLVQNIQHFYEASPEGWDRRAKMSELKHTPGLEYLLVRKDRHIAGFASFVVEDDYDDLTCLYVWEIHVSPEFLRQKIGHQLLARLVRIAKDSSQRRIMLRCFRDNQRARSFYESEGFAAAPDLCDETHIVYDKEI